MINVTNPLNEKNSPPKMEEWERNYLETGNISLEERKTAQSSRLENMLYSMNSFFGEVFIPAIKKARGDHLTDEEESHLDASKDSGELVERIKGLEKTFDMEFYDVLANVLGKDLFETRKKVAEVKEEEVVQEVTEDTVRPLKLPKGFNRWDLKQIKLHESKPTDGKRIWVTFWSLRGVSYIGEILYNPTKDLLYFRPFDQSNPSFALTDVHGRSATKEARNYYFQVSPAPDGT